MKPFPTFLAALLLAALPGQLRAADEAPLIAVLESNAGPKEKCEACRQLLDVGTPQCVPVLALALRDERTGHAALHTLERLPFPEASVALLHALASVQGPIRIGIISAAGWRKEAPAVPALLPLLADPDNAVAAAAAEALGRIGGPEAEQALSGVLEPLRPALQPAVAAGLLSCAEAHFQSGAPGKAADLYRRLRACNLPPPERSAALRGLLIADEGARSQLLGEVITGSHEFDREIALKFLHERPDRSALAALASRWPELPPAVQAALLENHSLLGPEATARAAEGAASPEELLRLTALSVMGQMKDSSLVPLLAKIAAEGSKPEKLAAQESLAAINGPGVANALASCLANAQGPVRAELLRVLARRGTSETALLLLPYANQPDETVRQAARQSLLILAAPASLIPLLELALASNSAPNRQQLVRIASEIARRPEGAAELSQAFELLLSRLGGPRQSGASRAITLELAEAAKASHPALAAKILPQFCPNDPPHALTLLRPIPRPRSRF